jgi:hypothetical protein
MAVAAEGPGGEAEGPTVRLKVEDGVIVFPVTAKGRKVSAEGVFEAVGASPEAKEAAGEHARQDAKASRRINRGYRRSFSSVRPACRARARASRPTFSF